MHIVLAAWSLLPPFFSAIAAADPSTAASATAEPAPASVRPPTALPPTAPPAAAPDITAQPAAIEPAAGPAPASPKPEQHRDASATTSAAPATKEGPGLVSSLVAPLKLSMFVDAYAAWQTGAPGTLASLSGHRAFSGQGANLRSENGFSLAFLGLDINYDAGTFGALANVRFGSAAAIYHYQASPDSDAVFAVDHLTQAYLFLRPVPSLEFDLGMFTSPFGFEALESWKNPNYTISALYVYGQPSWHTGLKTTWQIDDSWSVMAMVVNGSNNVSEAQQNGGLSQTPNVGASVGYAPNEALSFGLGGLYALDGSRNDDGGLDGFLDFVGKLTLDRFMAALNADYIFTRDGAPDGSNRHFFGTSLTAAYRLNSYFGIAARGEYLRDQANYGEGDVWQLATATLTLDSNPIPNVPNVIARFENRFEKSNQGIFGKDNLGTVDTADDTHTSKWFETVLSVVVTTAP